MSIRLQKTNLALLTAALALLATGGVVRADAIWFGENASNPIKAGGVKILRVEGSNLIFSGPVGDVVSKPLSQIQQLEVDDEPAFSSAEEAFRAGNTAAAATGYASSLRSSAKDWVQMRSAMRLTALSTKTHDFGSAVSAYIFLLQKDPSLAVRPPMVDADAGSLASAATQLKDALNTPNLAPSVAAPLLRLSVEVDRARGDTAGVDATLSRLTTMGVATPAENALAALAGAQASLAAGDFAKAADAIQQHRTMFTDPAMQVEALNVLATAHDGSARSATDPATLQDVAIDYMRVVTFGRELPGQPHVADALLRVAQIEETLKEPHLAEDIYRQIDKDYPTSPAAAPARNSLQRLGAN